MKVSIPFHVATAGMTIQGQGQQGKPLFGLLVGGEHLLPEQEKREVAWDNGSTDVYFCFPNAQEAALACYYINASILLVHSLLKDYFS